MAGWTNYTFPSMSLDQCDFRSDEFQEGQAEGLGLVVVMLSSNNGKPFVLQLLLAI